MILPVSVEIYYVLTVYIPRRRWTSVSLASFWTFSGKGGGVSDSKCRVTSLTPTSSNDSTVPRSLGVILQWTTPTRTMNLLWTEDPAIVLRSRGCGDPEGTEGPSPRWPPFLRCTTVTVSSSFFLFAVLVFTSAKVNNTGSHRHDNLGDRFAFAKIQCWGHSISSHLNLDRVIGNKKF